MSLKNILLAVLVLTFVSCKQNTSKKQTDTPTTQTSMKSWKIPDAIYSGVLPCDDCPETRTEIHVDPGGNVMKIEIKKYKVTEVTQNGGEWEYINAETVRIEYKNPNVFTEYYRLMPNGDLLRKKSVDTDYPEDQVTQYTLRKE